MRTIVVLLVALLGPSAAGCAQVDSAPSVTAQAGETAVKDVIAQYTLNPLVLVAATGKALPPSGQWSYGKVRPAVCPKDESVCLQVLYTVPESQVQCEWTVMPQHDAVPAKILDENADAAKYLLRKVGSAELASLASTSPQPTYPAIARAAHVAGSVVVRIVVSDQGVVTNAAVVSGPEMLRFSAMDTAKRWSFRPLKVGSQGVPFLGTLTATFVSGGNVSSGSVRIQP